MYVCGCVGGRRGLGTHGLAYTCAFVTRPRAHGCKRVSRPVRAQARAYLGTCVRVRLRTHARTRACTYVRMHALACESMQAWNPSARQGLHTRMRRPLRSTAALAYTYAFVRRPRAHECARARRHVRTQANAYLGTCLRVRLRTQVRARVCTGICMHLRAVARKRGARVHAKTSTHACGALSGPLQRCERRRLRVHARAYACTCMRKYASVEPECTPTPPHMHAEPFEPHCSVGARNDCCEV